MPQVWLGVRTVSPRFTAPLELSAALCENLSGSQGRRRAQGAETSQDSASALTPTNRATTKAPGTAPDGPQEKQIQNKS